MRIIADLSGAITAKVKRYNIFGNTNDVVKGALVIKGAIADATTGVVTYPTSVNAPADIVGILSELNDYSVAGDWTYNGAMTTVTNRPEVAVDVRPFGIVRSEMVETANTTFAVSDVTVTVGTGSMNDAVFSNSWLYEDGTEQLMWAEVGDTSAMTLNTSATTFGATFAVLVPPRFVTGTGSGGELNATFDKLRFEGDDTTYWQRVVDTHCQAAKGVGIERLLPWKMDQAVVSSAKLFTDFIIVDHVFDPRS